MTTGEFTDVDIWGGRPVARKIADAVPRGRVVVTGIIRSAAVTRAPGTPSCECTLDDGTGQIGLLFLGRPHVAGMVTGISCTVEGTARQESGRLVVWNPLYRIDPAGT